MPSLMLAIPEYERMEYPDFVDDYLECYAVTI